MPEALWILDGALAVAGTVVLLSFVTVHRGQVWQWPRTGDRGRVGPEHVALPMLGFVLVHLATAPLASSSDAHRLLANTLASVIAALLCLVIGGAVFNGGVRGFVLGAPSAPWRSGMSWAVGGLLAALPLVWATEWVAIRVLQSVSPGYEPPDHEVLEILARGDGPAWFPVLLWVGAVVVAPLAEEAFFRGVVQTALGRFLRRPLVAAAAVAVLFGLAHASQPHAVLPLAVLGFVLGYVYERSGTLLAPVMLHALFNLKTMLYFATFDR